MDTFGLWGLRWKQVGGRFHSALETGKEAGHERRLEGAKAADGVHSHPRRPRSQPHTHPGY